MLEIVKNFLWSYVFVPLFLITGVICIVSVITGKGDRRETTQKGEVSPLETLFVNLASTIGTGNIVGVSLAIGAGGPGAVFWMWAAAAVGMAVSYCENSLGVAYRHKNNQPIGYMPKGISKIFAFLCILTSFGIGNMVQSNSAADALFIGFGVEKWVTGFLFACLAFVIIRGGLKGITKFTDAFVPIMSLFFVVSTLMVIGMNYKSIPGVFESIFKEAFSLRAIEGGTLAIGIARGVMSGEAGIGSSVILCKKSNAKSAHEQGKIGAASIFIDTIVLCTLTALAILSSGANSTQGAFYSSLGVLGGGLLDLSITFFAFTTVIGWSFFGIECVKYLFGDKSGSLYKGIYACSAFFGAVLALDIVWAMGDISCALMAVPNLIYVCRHRLKKDCNY